MSNFKSQPNESLPMLLCTIEKGDKEKVISIVVEKYEDVSIEKS